MSSRHLSVLNRVGKLGYTADPRSIRLFQRSKRKLSSKRFFSSEKGVPGGKIHNSAPPPPPPSTGSGSSSGFALLITAGAVGAGIYFKDEISDYFNLNEKSVEEKTEAAVAQVKDTILKSEEKIEEIIKEEKEAVKPVVEKVVSATESKEVDWSKVRDDIVSILDNESYDDGSYGPLLVRLAWHSAGTFDKNTGKGGTEGAGMRFAQEGNWGANNGLDFGRQLLEPIKEKYPDITYSDLWSFAGTVAIEEMGGPEMKWRPGRKDCFEGENILPDGLLPDADGREHTSDPAKHVRFIFNRMGFNDQEIVALLGAHGLGRCHSSRSGYEGPWTNAPTTISTEYFRLLLEETWTPKQWDGPLQYEDSTKSLMMLPADMAFLWDEKFKKYVELYAKDEDKFFKDFAKAWMKLQENGVKKFHGWRRYIFFGPRE